MIRVGHATISVCCELPYVSTGQSASEGVMQTQLGLGGLTPGVASAAPLPARLRLSPVSTRKSEQAPLSSWSIVCGAHGRESDAWWSIPYLIVLCPGVVRRPTVEPLPDTGDVATPGYPCRGLVSEGLLVDTPTIHTPHMELSLIHI